MTENEAEEGGVFPTTTAGGETKPGLFIYFKVFIPTKAGKMHMIDFGKFTMTTVTSYFFASDATKAIYLFNPNPWQQQQVNKTDLGWLL